MATKTSPSRRSSSRASTTRTGLLAEARRLARSPPPRRSRRARRSTRSCRRRRAMRSASGWWSLALLAVLGLWFDAAGPVGGFLTWLLRGACGRGRGRCSRWSASTGAFCCCATPRARNASGCSSGSRVLVRRDPRAAVAARRATRRRRAGYDAVAAAGGLAGRARRAPARQRDLADRRRDRVSGPRRCSAC